MSSYHIKVILCSAMFYLAYKIILEKEKTHVFNRFYLLSSLIFAFIIPSITFNNSLNEQPQNTAINFENFLEVREKNIMPTTPLEASLPISEIVYYLYIVVTTMLFIRYLYNLKTLFAAIKSNGTISYGKTNLVLIEKNISPFSFLNYTFISEKQYHSNSLEKEILIHEFCHVNQKHTLDILLIEVLQVVFWFNPFIYLYRKAIQLNHEFLADAAVLNNCKDVKYYQNLLIDMVSENLTYNFSSRFNYSITKNRLIMMTKTKNHKRAILKLLTLIPILIAVVYIFSDKTTAQNTNITNSPTQKPASNKEVTEEEMLNFQQMVNQGLDKQGKPFIENYSAETKDKLFAIQSRMNKIQQEKQMIRIVLRPKPWEKKNPTESEMESWLDDKKYGVWIDNKRVKNKELKKYKTTDIAHVFVSKLAKNAYNYGKHYYQVDVMTNTEYEKYLEKELKNKEKHLMWYRPKSK